MSIKDRINTQNAIKIKPQIKENLNTIKNFERLKVNAGNRKDDFDVLNTLFEDETISAIFINGAKNIYIQKKGKIVKSSLVFKDNTRLLGILRKSAQLRGLEIDELNPFVSFKLDDGIFLSATIPPITNVPVVNIKFYRQKYSYLSKILEDKAISKEMALTLEAIIRANEQNIIILGKKNTFKTTLLAALSRTFPKNLRAVMVDFKDEIKFPLITSANSDFPNDFENFTYYNCDTIYKNYNDNIVDMTFNNIFENCPDRLFFNSPDERAINKILQAMQNGQKGIVMTLEANNIEDAIKKLTFILLKNNPHLTYKKAQLLCYELFDITITTDFDESLRRKVSYVTQLKNEDGNIKSEDIFFLNPLSEHMSAGFVPDFYKNFDNNFISLGVNIFDSNYKHTYDKSYETIEEISYKVTNEDNKVDELESYRIRRKTNRQLIKSAKDNLEKLKKKVSNASLIEEKLINKKLEKVSQDEFDE